MSNKNRSNYNKMYDGAGKRAETKPVDEAIPAEVKEEVVEAVVESVKMEKVVEAKPVTGVVECELLNVRVAPNKEATVAAVIVEGAKVTINKKESTDGWYKVITEAGIEGYCMKKFIAV